MSKRRVVVTGLGWVTSKGTNVNDVFKSLTEGQSWITPLSNFDTTDFDVKFGGQISSEWWDGPINFEGPNRKKYAKKLDRFTQSSDSTDKYRSSRITGAKAANKPCIAASQVIAVLVKRDD